MIGRKIWLLHVAVAMRTGLMEQATVVDQKYRVRRVEGAFCGLADRRGIAAMFVLHDRYAEVKRIMVRVAAINMGVDAKGVERRTIVAGESGAIKLKRRRNNMDNDNWNECDEPKLLGRFESAADLIAGFLIGLIAAGIVMTFGF